MRLLVLVLQFCFCPVLSCTYPLLLLCPTHDAYVGMFKAVATPNISTSAIHTHAAAGAATLSLSCTFPLLLLCA